MADLPAIDDSNTFAAKSDAEAVPSGEDATHVAAADLNALKARVGENRTQANTALSTADGAVTDAATAQAAADAAQVDATQALSDAATAQATADTKADALPTAPAEYTGATLTLADAYANYRARVSAASNAVAIEIPDTLTGGGSGDTTCFECTLIVTDATTNAVTISTGAGLLTPVYYGASTITVDNTLVAISVVRGVAYVAIVEPA